MEQRLNYLLNQFTAGTLTPEEKQELYFLVDTEAPLVSAEIVEMIAAQEVDAPHSTHPKWEAVLHQILSIDKPKPNRLKLVVSRMKWVAAAVLFTAFSLATYLVVTNKKKEHVFTSDVAPGGNKAFLTLADGRKISLTDAAAGDVIKESGLSVTKKANGQLIYNVESGTQPIDDSQTNTISTPKGGEWEVRLPDGSVVWLNAASSIKYHLNIGTSKHRKVELTGEAYFEVAKDKLRPFIVKTARQELEVLGTHFDISSYLDDPVTRTTLLEGSVSVSNLDKSNSEILKPGQQAILTNGDFQVRDVDTDQAVAWKDGYFMFNNEKQESILRKLARWYNVEVEYVDPEAKEVMYYGTVSRFEKISKVLRKFEQTGEVRFEIKGNKVIVYKA